MFSNRTNKNRSGSSVVHCTALRAAGKVRSVQLIFANTTSCLLPLTVPGVHCHLDQHIQRIYWLCVIVFIADKRTDASELSADVVSDVLLPTTCFTVAIYTSSAHAHVRLYGSARRHQTAP